MSDHEGKTLQALHFPINVRSLPQKGFDLRLDANEEERELLAKTHGLLAVNTFSANFLVRPWKKRGVFVEGQIKADITQQCVVTSEPLNNKVEKKFEARFVPEDSRLAKYPEMYDSGELFLDPEGDDTPETFTGSEIDAGQLAEEFFELAVDPYPRRSDVSFKTIWQEENIDKKAGNFDQNDAPTEDENQSPFAVLEKLKQP